jgi:ankyrin repeat protein
VKYYLFLAILLSSLPSFAFLGVDECHPIKEITDCHFQVRSNIMRDENQEIALLLKEHGIDWFFDHKGISDRYSFFSNAIFFGNPGFFKLITKHPGYPKAIPDKNEFLSSVLVHFNLNKPGPQIVKMLFDNSEKNKTLNWFENVQWPYPFLAKFKEETLALNDKDKYKSLLDRFDKIDNLKKNICQIQNLEQLKASMEDFSGIEVLFKRNEHNLLECAVKSGNLELAKYLLDNGHFNSLSLPGLISNIEGSPIYENNLHLIKAIQEKMVELNIPHTDKNIKKHLWVLEHLPEETECLQKADNGELIGIKNYTDLIEKIVLMAVKKELAALKEATLTGDKAKEKVIVGHIGELFNQSGMPANYRDESGKTIMHHLAAFADGDIIDLVEGTLNTSSNTMNYSIQDNDGNTPTHVAIKSRNLSGGLALVDQTVRMQNGFGYSVRPDLKLENLEKKTPLELLKEWKASKVDRKAKKAMEKFIKDEISPKERFE